MCVMAKRPAPNKWTQWPCTAQACTTCPRRASKRETSGCYNLIPESRRRPPRTVKQDSGGGITHLWWLICTSPLISGWVGPTFAPLSNPHTCSTLEADLLHLPSAFTIFNLELTLVCRRLPGGSSEHPSLAENTHRDSSKSRSDISSTERSLSHTHTHTRMHKLDA